VVGTICLFLAIAALHVMSVYTGDSPRRNSDARTEAHFTGWICSRIAGFHKELIPGLKSLDRSTHISEVPSVAGIILTWLFVSSPPSFRVLLAWQFGMLTVPWIFEASWRLIFWSRMDFARAFEPCFLAGVILISLVLLFPIAVRGHYELSRRHYSRAASI